MNEPTRVDPQRTDLAWLRHRRARPPVNYVKARAAPPAPSPPAPTPPAPTPRAPARPTPSAPTQSPPAPSPAPPARLLDLSRVPSPTEEPRPRRHGRPALPYPRVEPGGSVVLAPGAATVTLTRLQSGTGLLRATLVRGAAAGDMEMGVVLQSTDGTTHVVQRLGDVPAASVPGAPLPLVRLLPDDTLVIDLRQVGVLRRALLYAHSPHLQVLDWDAAVLLSGHDGYRVSVPFDLPQLSGCLALVTVYAVHGELVLRAELEPFAGPPEAVAQAYGYDYGWLEDRMPVPPAPAPRR